MTTYNFESWEDINIFPVVETDTQYKIEIDGGETIFSGTVLSGYKLEYINEILSQYMDVNFPDIYTHTFTSDNTKTFNVYSMNSSATEWTLDYKLNISYNWAYKQKPSGVISDPISNILDYRQFLMYTTLYDTNTNITVNLEGISVPLLNYTSEADKITTLFYDLSSIVYPGEFSYDFSDDYYVQDIIPPRDYTIIINNQRYYVVHSCKNYALYYINAYGGFDSILLQGNTIQSDTISNLSYTKKNSFVLGMNNRDFGTVNYKKTIKESWELNTHPLNDVQSAKINQLLESNNIYLHSLNDNQITPVNISTSNIQYKTFRNQNRKFPIYTFNVESAQTKYRFN